MFRVYHERKEKKKSDLGLNSRYAISVKSVHAYIFADCRATARSMHENKRM